MDEKVFTSEIYGDKLVIRGNEIEVTNRFGDVYKGRMDAYGKITTKSKFALGYIVRAMEEFRGEVSAVK